MMPSDLRLLLGIRASVANLSQSIANRDQQEVLGVIDVVIEELIKRQNHAFYAGRFGDGKALVLKGIALLEERRLLSNDATLSQQASLLPPSVDLSSNSDAAGQHLARVRTLLERIVALLTPIAQPDAQAYLVAVTNWECALVAPARDSAPSGRCSPAGLSVNAPELQAYIRRRFPERGDAEVTNFERLPGGYSKITILFGTRAEIQGQQSLVLRAEQPVTPFHMDGADVVNEFSVLRIAHAAGLPVAEPLWVEDDPTLLGARFLVSRRAKGGNFGSVLAGNQVLSEQTIKNVLAVLAKIHTTKLDVNDPWVKRSHLRKWLEFETLTECTRAYVGYWREISRKCGGEASPAITRGFNWLLDNVPQCDEKPGLVHGDYGLHNMMIEDGRVTAVLDWEASYAGDPADEFFLFTHVMSQYVKPSALMDWYAQAGGRRIGDYRLKYFNVLNTIKGPLVGYGALSLVANYSDIDVKNAYIGLRYVHLPLSNLNRAIEEAEAAKAADAIG
jgi:aminoglycoside phosphotransferase (APT) family kinase protein